MSSFSLVAPSSLEFLVVFDCRLVAFETLVLSGRGVGGSTLLQRGCAADSWGTPGARPSKPSKVWGFAPPRGPSRAAGTVLRGGFPAFCESRLGSLSLSLVKLS